MYTYDSTFEELDAAVRRVGGYLPVPDVDFNQAPLYWLHLTNDYTEEQKKRYERVYKEILDPYLKYNADDIVPGCDKTFGFNDRELNHPLLNVMMLDTQRMHYKFMKPILKKVQRQVERQERKNGQKYDNVTFLRLVREQALELRREEMKIANTKSFAKFERETREAFNAKMEAEFQQQLREERAAMSVGERVVDFAQEHPFMVGLIGGMMYQRVKHFFER